MITEIDYSDTSENKYKEQRVQECQDQLEIVEKMQSEIERFKNELSQIATELIDRKTEAKNSDPSYWIIGNLRGTRSAGDIKRAAMTLERKLLKFRRDF